jgi:uncharacterized protein (DUF2252 family)
MRENPKGWRSRFRKMAENAFAFYCGSAVLFSIKIVYRYFFSGLYWSIYLGC